MKIFPARPKNLNPKQQNISHNRLKSFHSNGIMSVMSCPKARIISLFPCSSSLNGSSRFTKQYRVHVVYNEKEKNSKY